MADQDFFKRTVHPKLLTIVKQEMQRQKDYVNLIASENFTSPAVLELTGSVLTNKYCEGYPGKRYYSGCRFIDAAETLAQDLIKKLFACDCSNADCKKANAHANVQPHSGSQANEAAYATVLKPGDAILGMNLQDGGHLTHGFHVNFSGKIYQGHSYGVDPKSGEINYEDVRKIALKCKPKLIIAGASAYPLIIDWSKFRAIADEVGAYLLTDVAHIAGLIVAGQHPNPACYADIITSTTHKTLRGPRGGIILCRAELAAKVDKAVFPRTQGGPLEHTIIAKAQAFYEAQQPDFIKYQQYIVENASTMATVFKNHGFIVVGGKSENHLFTVNTKDSFIHLTGKEAAERLEKINIIVNKNTVPQDTESPFVTSGVRFGTPAMTTRGFCAAEFKMLAHLIIQAWTLSRGEFENKVYILKEQVLKYIQDLDFYPESLLPAE